jgi:Tfp pilus assembly protein PilN
MPLHVNLYHEVQRQALARRRDPLRIGLMGLGVIAAGFVAYYFVALEQTHQVVVQYESYQDTFAKLDPRAKAAKTREDELTAEITASQSMQQNVDNRFYWAPVLGQIVATVPRTVQLTHVSAETPQAGRTLSTNTIVITGIASAAEPRKEAEALRTALAAHFGTAFKDVTSEFKTLDDSDQIVMLDGRRLATANFTIQLQLGAKVDPAPVAAAPAPARKPRLIAAQ